MAGEIASAYVRIRPNLTGFRAETEAGVEGAVAGSNSAFAGIGKKVAATVGIAIGAQVGFQLVKSAVSSAAAVQKTTEVIRNQFGSASKSVLNFANNSGVALGSLNENTLATSSKLSFLFKSLGFGTDVAAKMTTGWEKLALAMNAAQGGGPQGAVALLQKIPQATRGSARSLLQLGLGFNTAQIQAYEFAHGAIPTLTTALNPAQKAAGSFALAIQELPQRLALAQAHSGDFANVTARLSAEWGKAKEELGGALLPVITRAAKSLGDWLQRMERSGKLQKDFNSIITITTSVVRNVVSAVKLGVSIFEGFAHVVGGTGNAIKILLALLVVSKIAAISGEFKRMGATLTGPVRAGIVGVRTAWAGVASAASVASKKTTADYTTAATRIRVLNAQIAAGSKTTFAKVGADSKAATNTMSTAFARAAAASEASVVSATSAMDAAMVEYAATTKAETTSTRVSFTGMFASVKAGAIGAFTTVEAVGVGALTTIKAAFLSLFAVAWPLLIGTAVAYAITHWEQVKRYTLALVHASVEAFRGMANIIVGWYRYIYGKALYYLITPIKEFIDVLAKAAGWIPFIGGGLSKAAAAVDSFTNSVHKFAEGGRRQIIGGFSDITHGVTKAWSDSLAKSTTDTKAKANAHKLGQTAAQQFNQGLTQTLAQSSPAITQTLNDTLQNAVQAANQKIHSTIQAAKNNLVKIGDDLAKTIDKIQQKIGGAAGAVAGSPQGQAFEKLKKLIESGAPSFEIAKAQAELSGQLKGVGKTQQSQVKTQLDNLTAALNTGKISYKQFNERLHEILRKDGISLGAALKAGGASFRDTFKAEVAALKLQAKAIADLPAKFRSIGGAGGAADIKIIKPLEVIRQEQTKVAIAAAKQREQQLKQQQAIAKNAAKQTAYQQQMATIGIHVRGPVPGSPPLNVQQFIGPHGREHGRIPTPRVTPPSPPRAQARVTPPPRIQPPRTPRGPAAIPPRVQPPQARRAPAPIPVPVPRPAPRPASHTAKIEVFVRSLEGIRAAVETAGKTIRADIVRLDPRLEAIRRAITGIHLTKRPGPSELRITGLTGGFARLGIEFQRLIAIQGTWRAASLAREGSLLSQTTKLDHDISQWATKLLQATDRTRQQDARFSSEASRERLAQTRVAAAELAAIERVRSAILTLRPRPEQPRVHVEVKPSKPEPPRIHVEVKPSRPEPPRIHVIELKAPKPEPPRVKIIELKAPRPEPPRVKVIELKPARPEPPRVKVIELKPAKPEPPRVNVEVKPSKPIVIERDGGQARGQQVTRGHLASATATLARGLREICADVIAADKDIVGAIQGTRTPMENLRRTEVRIGDEASRQRAQMIREGRTTNSLLRRLDRNKGPVPGFHKERPGTGSHHARKAHQAGVKV